MVIPEIVREKAADIRAEIDFEHFEKFENK